ncbi:MAG: calcium-binding protein, partial [Kiloniellaceae bacterium]
AGTGVDTVTLGTGDDTLDLGAGNDTIAATSTTLNATDDLDGGLGTDSLALTGGGAFDLSGLAGFVNIEAVMLDDSGSDLTLRDGVDLTVTAGTGADTVTLGTGDDTLDAGGGDDTVQAAAAAFNVADDLDGGLGTDTLVLTGGGTFNLPGLARFVNFEALVMDNSGASLTLRDGISLSVTAGLGADIVTLGNGNDTIEATAAALNAADELTGGAGTDLLHLLAAGTYDLSALAAFATFEAILTTGNTDLTLSAAAGIVVTLDNATNTVIGGTAADTVILGTGTDTLNLGDGVDVVRGTLATLNLTDDLDGGLGTDILELTGGGTLSLAGLVDFTGFEEIALDDNSWNLTLVGGQGIALTGGAGDDVVLGVAGDQTLNLGGGDDTLDLSLSLDAVTVDLGTAAAQLISATQGTDTLQGIENLRGSIFSDLLTGDANANTLTGLLGDDTLIGGGGADVLDGGLGIDAMTGGAGADQFVFDGPLDGTPVLLDVGIVLGLDLYDLLPDFQTGEDQLVLSEAGFGLGGALTDGVNFFTIGGAYTGINVGAAPGVPIIVVDGTNSVYYDPSGGALGLPGYVVLAEGLNTQPVIGDFAFAA